MIAAGVKLGWASPELKLGTLVYPFWNAGSAASKRDALSSHFTDCAPAVSGIEK